MDKLRKNLRRAIQTQDWESVLSRLKGAYAEGTLRAYKVDIRSFVGWCSQHNLEPFPASPETLAAFVTHEAERRSVSTIKRRLAALGKIHQLLRLKNAVNDQEVVIAVRRALRSKYSRPRQALGLTQELRDKLISATSDNDLFSKRNRAILAVGYDTLCRRSELVALQVEDLLILRNTSAKILVRRSKNDPFGQGRLAYISTTALKLLHEWIEAAKIEHGPIFRAIRKNHVYSKALHPYSINRIIKQSANKAQLSKECIANLSGHSLRVGAAQDMMAAGYDILPIMRAGGWKTANVVARYTENTELMSFMGKLR
jgi:integrase/recombinase XerD